MSVLELTIANHAQSISSLKADMVYVIPLAENADNYAHSHYSDENLKDDIYPIHDSIDAILDLEGVSFRWNEIATQQLDLPTGIQYGLIAQDVAKIFPELVTESSNGYLTVDYV